MSLSKESRASHMKGGSTELSPGMKSFYLRVLVARGPRPRCRQGGFLLRSVKKRKVVSQPGARVGRGYLLAVFTNVSDSITLN